VARLKQRASRVAQIARGSFFIGVALAANAVSQLMPDLYGWFRSPVPPAVFALDYLDREAQLRSLARQPAKVAAAVRALGQTWARVRSRVVAAGGSLEAGAYQKHVATMNELDPQAAEKLQAEAVNGLNLVDELENVFTR
jgi:hypothetical protein